MELDDGIVFYNVLIWYLNKVRTKNIVPEREQAVSPFRLMPTSPWATPSPRPNAKAMPFMHS